MNHTFWEILRDTVWIGLKFSFSAFASNIVGPVHYLQDPQIV